MALFSTTRGDNEVNAEPIWHTEEGLTMARCPDCNGVHEIQPTNENVIEVGANGQVEGVICQDCWNRLERSGARTA
jgi:hypothetical protein